MRKALAPLVILVIGVAAPVGAQQKHPPAPAEWGQFEQLRPQPRGGLSPDGKWLVYGIGRSNRNDELRIKNIASGSETTAAFGSQPLYSADSKWIAYSLGYSEAEEDRLRTQRKPIHRKLGLLRLDGTSEPAVVEGIESFSFDPSGTFLVMRRYAPERRDAQPAGGGPPPPSSAASPPSDEAPPVGSTVIVRDLRSGRDLTFGNISEYAWQNVSDPSRLSGRMLALVVSAEDKIGNGVHLLDAMTGAHRVLDSAASVYSGLSWRRDADDLAVLRAHTDDKREGATHAVLAWTAIASLAPRQQTLDPLKSAVLPAGIRTAAFRRPTWSDDGQIVFVGIAAWEEKLTPEKPAEKPVANSGEAPRPASENAEENATVEIWHSRDVYVMPRQKLSARTDRQRNMLAAWHVHDGKLVQLGRDVHEVVTPLRHQPRAYVSNWSTYAMERTIGRTAADVALVDLATGARTKVADRIDDGWLQASPRGRFLLYFHADDYWTIDTTTGAVVNITKKLPTAFVNRESDFTVRQKPPFGAGGWTKNDDFVLLYDKFDIWLVAANGTGARKLTDGAAEQVRHRYVRIDPDEEFIDAEKPLMVSLFGLWSKRSGYGRVLPGTQKVERLLFEDKGVGALGKARDADVYVYGVQAFDDSPDLFVGGPGLKGARQITATNPFISKYAWGRAELIEYKSDRGDRLQGTLIYPAAYEAGKKYPLVVYLYEKLSDNIHRFIAPSDREYYNLAVFTAMGYAVLQPDIAFRPREPGLSVVECVEPAVRKAVSMGVADAARVGVVGHSWGGFDAAYLATHSSVFAASVAGAAITNLVSNYGNHHWSSGIAETDHIETGQQRMEVPLYEDLQAYIRNSPVFNVHNMKTPLLLEVGDNDGTVHWHQGVELYNIARRAKKNVVMVAYGGEDHALRRKANQMDYQRRILQWFGHYLKNEPAAPWITSGWSFLERERELKRAQAMKKGT